MNDNPTLETDILRVYFKETRYQDDKYIVEITLISGIDHYGFEVSIEVKQPDLGGAFPQRRVALEQHISGKHKGVHVQINYHLINNELNIGRLHIMIDTNNDKELLDISVGFVYTLYEMLKGFGPDFQEIFPKLFKVELLDGIKDKKIILMRKIKESFENRAVEIRNLAGEIDLITVEEVRRLVRSRRELMPLLGSVLE
jgi:hypothetical protein